MPKVSDAARRMSEAVNIAVLGGHAGDWMAFRLSDGTWDGVFYHLRAEAIRHQLHETQCCYVCVPYAGMPERSAELYLNFNRQLYDAGMRMTDPEGPEVFIPSTRNEEWSWLTRNRTS